MGVLAVLRGQREPIEGVAGVNERKRPKAAPRRRWLRNAAIALAILLICPVALWLLIGWGAFAPEPIEPDMRLFLAKAAQPDVNVYECGEIPGTYQGGPPEDLSAPLRQITPDDVVCARVLPTPDQAGNRWAELLYGDCVRLDDLIPATPDDRGVLRGPSGGPVPHVPRGTDPYSEDAEAWYGTRDEPAIFLYLCGRCAFYRPRPDAQVQWLIARVLTHEAGFRTGVYVWPREADLDGVPDVLVLQPPLGLACFGWDGDTFRPRFPTLRQFGELIYLVVRGAPGPARWHGSRSPRAGSCGHPCVRSSRFRPTPPARTTNCHAQDASWS